MHKHPGAVFCPAFDGPCFSSDCSAGLCQSAIVAAEKTPPMTAQEAIRWPAPGVQQTLPDSESE